MTTQSPSSSRAPERIALEERARTYLHANCSNCHRGDKRPSLHFDKTLADTQLCSAPALLVPGDPATSGLVKLMRSSDPSVRMRVKLIEDWVRARTSCP